VILLLTLGCVRTVLVGDSGVTTDSQDTSRDTGPGTECALAVPAAQTLSAPVSGEPSFPFALPDAQWALSTAHVARQVDGAGPRALPPAFWLALAMERTRLSCGNYGDPWGAGDSPQGCLEIHRDTHWVQLDRLHPDWFRYDRYDALIPPTADQARVVAGVQAAAWQLTSTLPVVAHDDLGGWIQDAPAQSWFELAALVHVFSPWASQVSDGLACPDDPGACTDAPDIDAIGALATELHTSTQASCYDEPLTQADMLAYLAALEDLWPDLDWETARAELPDPGRFQAVGPAVLDAADAAGVRLHCPGSQLQDYYSVECL
jgi:hypothetical protein